MQNFAKNVNKDKLLIFYNLKNRRKKIKNKQRILQLSIAS